jgi:broad specificity phosphatase PhoE
MGAILALMRHGQAAPGDSAPARPLTDLGRWQAAAAGRWLGPTAIGKAFATDTPRARETAALAGGGIKVHHATGLEGLRIGGDETPLRGVAALSTPFADPRRRSPGGESLLDLQERARAGLARIAAAGPEPTLVVAHRFVDCVLVAFGLGVPLERAEPLLQDPGAVNLWEEGPRPRLRAVNLSPLDPLRTGGIGLLLPDTDTPVERRRYLLAVGPGEEQGDLVELHHAAAGLDGIEATVEALAPGELAAACAEAAELGAEAADLIPAPVGSLAILDGAARRWWIRTLGWTRDPRFWG